MQRLLLTVLLGACLHAHSSELPLPKNADDLFVAKRWQTEDGLPQNSVLAIAQTPDGYLWLGTFNGLVRFDGVRFTTYSVGNTPELRSDNITILAVSPDGTLWIGTNGAGLVRYSGGRFQRLSEADGINDLDVHFILNDPKGGMWVGSRENLFRTTGGAFTKVAHAGPELYPFRDMALDSTGQVWIWTGQGVRKLKDGTLVEPTPSQGDAFPGGPQHPSEERVLDLRDGLLTPNRGTTTLAEFAARWPSRWIAREEGEVWSIGGGKPVQIFRDGSIWQFQSQPFLNQGDLTAVFADLEKNVWLGFDGGGLVRLRPKLVKTYSKLQGLPSNNTVSLAEEASGRIWAGRLGGERGLTWILPREERVVPEADGWERHLTSCVFRTRDGTMWVGTHEQGLFRWRNGVFEQRRTGPDPHTKEWQDLIRVLFEDRSGRFWIGLDGSGAQCIQDGILRRFTVAEGLSHKKVTAIAEDPAGHIWIGTADGLNRIAPDGTIQRFGRKDGLNVPAIHALFVSQDGTLWIGTAGGGLSIYRASGFESLTTEHGLLNDVVAQILEDDAGNLWIGTNRGISRMNVAELKAFFDGKARFVRSFSYGVDDGMISPECGGGFQPACLKASDGGLWFCTVGGIVRIDPSAPSSPSRPPRVFLEEAWLDRAKQQVFHSDVAPDRLLIVPPATRSLEIRFTGIHLRTPEKVIFRYKLENYDSDWNDAGTRRSAYYTGLPPGRYRFRVTGGNDEGRWDTTGAELAVWVQPAWWQSTWFHGCSAIAILGLSIGAYHWRVSGLKRERRRKAEFSRRLIESQEGERQRISRELHDGLGLSLALIKNHAGLALQGAKENRGTNGRAERFGMLQEHVLEISRVASDAVEEVRHVAHDLHPVHLNQLGLTRSLEALADRMAKSGDLQLTFALDDLDGRLALRDQNNLLRIVQECLNNVLKHARASSVEISSRCQDGVIRLAISDDGRGFDPRAMAVPGTAGGLGLMAMRERVEILGGQIEFESKPGEGTKVTVTIAAPKRPLNSP